MKLQKARIYATNASSQTLTSYSGVRCVFSFKPICSILLLKRYYNVYRARYGTEFSVTMVYTTMAFLTSLLILSQCNNFLIDSYLSNRFYQCLFCLVVYDLFFR